MEPNKKKMLILFALEGKIRAINRRLEDLYEKPLPSDSSKPKESFHKLIQEGH